MYACNIGELYLFKGHNASQSETHFDSRVLNIFNFMLKKFDFSSFKLSDAVFIMLINFKVPTLWHYNTYKPDKFHAPLI